MSSEKLHNSEKAGTFTSFSIFRTSFRHIERSFVNEEAIKDYSMLKISLSVLFLNTQFEDKDEVYLETLYYIIIAEGNKDIPRFHYVWTQILCRLKKWGIQPSEANLNSVQKGITKIYTSKIKSGTNSSILLLIVYLILTLLPLTQWWRDYTVSDFLSCLLSQIILTGLRIVKHFTKAEDIGRKYCEGIIFFILIIVMFVLSGFTVINCLNVMVTICFINFRDNDYNKVAQYFVFFGITVSLALNYFLGPSKRH